MTARRRAWARQLSSDGWSRRAFLGGAAAVVALPWMPSLRGARADDVFPTRMLWWFVPNGLVPAGVKPVGTGALGVLPPTLAGLEVWRDQVTVVSGLDNAPARIGRVGPEHAASCSGWLTSSLIQAGTMRAGVSVDQVVAPYLAGPTPFRSLQLAIDGARASGSCSPDYPCAYESVVSWGDVRTPLPPLSDPRVLFDRLFGGLDDQATAEEQARRARWRGSVLDAVVADAKALQGQLAVSDRLRLDQYLTAVRELEERLGRLADGVVCDPGIDAPADTQLVEARIEAFTDLMVLAMSCDLTRTTTFMLGNEQSARGYDWLGVSGQHHGLSHHAGDAGTLADLMRIEAWEVDQYAAFLGKLAAVSEGDGTLLDHCAVVLGSGLGDGDAHLPLDLTTVVAGGAGGRLVQGRHLAFDGRPLADLHQTLLHVAGADTAFADSSGVLEPLLS